MCESVKEGKLPMVNIQDIARYTILRLIQNGNSICPLKLQKVLYYMQAWHMVYFSKDNTLFKDVPEAWVNGPVYRVIYDAYKHIPMYNQIRLIDIGIKDTEEDLTQNISEECKKTHKELFLTAEQDEFIESIFAHYGTMDHDRLVFLTHIETPWSEQREGLLPFEHSEKALSLDTMYSYYNQRRQSSKTKES